MDNEPSFASLLEETDKKTAPSNETSQEPTPEQASNPQVNPNTGQDTLPASLLFAFAANDASSTAAKQQDGTVDPEGLGEKADTAALQQTAGPFTPVQHPPLPQGQGEEQADAFTISGRGGKAKIAPTGNMPEKNIGQAVNAGPELQAKTSGAATADKAMPIPTDAGVLASLTKTTGIQKANGRDETATKGKEADIKTSSLASPGESAKSDAPQPAVKGQFPAPQTNLRNSETSGNSAFGLPSTGDESGQAQATAKPVASTSGESVAKGDNPGNTGGDSLTPPKPVSQQTAGLLQINDSPAQTAMKAADGITPAFSATTAIDGVQPGSTNGQIMQPANQNSPQVPLNNIAVHIASQARAGNHHFNIRLDPPELGRIDIKLEITRDGQTLTHLAVEKPDTLDMLRQDSRQLERALNNAGLDSRNGSLSFSLRDDSQNRRQASTHDPEGPLISPDKTEEREQILEPVITRTLNISSGLDISI